jgi:hypothetical protein
MATRMQQRRGTAAQWTSADPVLNAGEIGFESDTNKFKIGDGDNHWTDLNYFLDAVALGGNIDDYIPLTQKDAANGVATLNSNKNVVVPGTSVIIEGLSDNSFETTLTVIDPADNRTITFPDATGTVQLRVTNVSDTEIGYLDGVTSSIQTQLNDKLSLASGGVMNNPFSMGGYKITSLGAPTSDSDAVTKVYVDNVSSGISFNKAVRAATTANITLSGTQTVDGVSLSVGDRVLVKNQTTQTENGIYDVASGSWSRSVDADNNPTGELAGGDFCLVLEGTVNQSYGYVCSNTSAITIGTTNITYTAFNAAKAISAGNGLIQATPGVLSIDEAITQTRVENVSNTEIGYLNGVTSSIQVQLDDKSTANKTETLTNKTLTSPVINTPTGITKNDIGLANVDNTSDVNKPISTATQTALGDKLDSATASTTYETIANVALKAPSESPTFTGTVVLPSTTSIGTISSTEIGYVDGVTSSIQTQLNGKQAIVSGVSDVEIGYLDGVTSSIQTQLDAKSTDSKTETLTNKTLTSPVINTPTGITKSDVGLGNVDNTSDVNKPVSTATQTALDLKLALAGGTMTGALTLSADPSSSLHAATKQYVDNTASGVIAKPQVLGATALNIDATYSNGTAGVGATLTHNTNGVFPADAGGASGWAVGKGILVKNQTNKAQNGRYYISNMGSVSTPYVLTRCTYCDEASEIPGAYIFVQDGTFAGTGWIQVVADPATFVVGTDNIDVFQFSGSGTITAGTNISVSGNEISVVATPSLSGVAFSDGTQTKEGVPSRTPIIAKTDSYTLSALTERDSLIEVAKASATTITIPLNSAVAFPVGTSLDILQTSTGQVTIAGAAGVTVNATPGLKLRTQWSSCTLFKRAENTWVVYGDLTA